MPTSPTRKDCSFFERPLVTELAARVTRTSSGICDEKLRMSDSDPFNNPLRRSLSISSIQDLLVSSKSLVFGLDMEVTARERPMPLSMRARTIAFDVGRPSSQEWILETLEKAFTHDPTPHPSLVASPSHASVLSLASVRRSRSMSVDSTMTAFWHEDSLEVHVRRKRREAHQRISGPAPLLLRSVLVVERPVRPVLWGRDSIDIVRERQQKATRAWPKDSIDITRERKMLAGRCDINEPVALVPLDVPSTAISARKPDVRSIFPVASLADDQVARAEPAIVDAELDPDSGVARESDVEDEQPVAGSSKQTIGRKDTIGRKAARKIKALFTPNAPAMPTAVSTMTID